MESTVPQKKRNGLFIASLVFLILSLLFFCVFTPLASGVMTIQPEEDENETAGEAIGEGIGIALSLIILIVMEVLVGLATVVLSGIGTAVSGALIKRAEGGRRVYAIIATVADALVAAGTVVFFALSLALRA